MPACQQGSARLYWEYISAIQGNIRAQMALALDIVGFELLGRGCSLPVGVVKMKGPILFHFSCAAGKDAVWYLAPQPVSGR